MDIFLITIFGLLLRLINIDKPEGLWNDEYVSWYISSKPLLGGFFESILNQCHMPLYYFYLKPFSMGDDIILRFSSVIPGILAIPVMYLAGKEFSRKIALLAATITAVLPFLVYYSQEVRFYSLLFVLSAISLLFTIRLIKESNKINILGYIIALGLIIFTHVLGIIYAIFNFGYVLFKKNLFSKKLVYTFVAYIVLLIPFGLNILKMHSYSQWWGNFSYTNILFLFSDMFSPILSNHVSAPQEFFYQKTLLFVILIAVPTILAIIAILLGAKRFKGLFLIAIAVILSMVVLALISKVVFITKYLIEILPIFILLVSVGFLEIPNRIIKCIYIITFFAFQLFAIITPYYQVKIPRIEGHKLAANLLVKYEPDVIVYNYYQPLRFNRYYDQRQEKNIDISKTYRSKYRYLKQQILNDVNIGDNVSILILDSVSFIPPKYLNSDKAKKMPEMFQTYSIIRNRLENEIVNSYKDIKVDRAGSWVLINATKYK